MKEKGKKEPFSEEVQKQINAILPFNERQALELNEDTSHTRCTVTMILTEFHKHQTWFTEGLPHVHMQACRGGANMTVRFFVPDYDPFDDENA